MRKRRRLILLLVIFLSLGGVAYKVVENTLLMKVREIKRNPLKALEYLPESALHMKDFHRSKIEDGRKIWELFGDEANYYKDQKEAVIKNPRFYYYDKQGETATTTGDVAHLFFTENELEKMELQGSIQMTFHGYVLKSDEATYFAGKELVIMPSRTTIVGDGAELEGSRMEVELGETKKMRMVRNVKTKIEPEKLKEMNKKSTPTQMSEGG
jgi:LPS export ABC transporter protein LptC